MPPSYPVAQFPNAPLIVAFGGLAVAAVTDDTAQDYAMAVHYAGLTAWAWLELTDGDNAFRRVLGAAGLAFVVARVGAGLGG